MYVVYVLECMGTPSVPNGIVFQQNVTKVFHLTCLDGYHSTQGDEIRCLPSCNWTFAECNPVDCRLPPQISNGHLATYSSTLYPSIIKLQCDPGYVLRNQDFMQCQSNGSWSLVLCSLIDCGLPPSLANGMMALRNNSTTFTSQAEVSCNPGYFLNGSYSIIHCTTQGRWTQDSFKCLPVECPVLDPYDKLTIELDPYTTKSIVNTTAMFSCPPSSILVCYKRIKCTINGQWTGPVPKCIMLEKTVRNCQVDVDTKDRTWRETQPGTIVVENCPNGYSGKVSRQCSEEGLWLNAFYNCVSERVAQLLYESFFAATSNLLDYDNAESWKSGGDHYKNNGSPDRTSTAYLGAMKVLNVVDKYADILMNTLANNSESSKTIQMDNMVVHVSMVNTTSDDLKFPHKPLGITSSVILPKASLKGSNSIAAVVYRNLTGIMSSKPKNDRHAI
ncbi:sushi, von Willebrand factor type A, EGF and pentraxin domain-containing protein 1-like [Dreissena polymorpha]|uniref:sushi, von Willebrand factor type A, EGF and pentraxin domain-containing protein 1-like n=1 Tax=Dreissena polymorpha TaxID=45954 RepID=UPI00226424EF|nr:sushi, von Willebrand factor type A, EGF and pentraxin domain-containing protein 1-like [Dreissena polymorpha]